jgi:putative flippase GtrA
MGGRHAAQPRLGRLYAEIAKFGVVGALGVVVNIAAFNLLRAGTGMPTVQASVTATGIAVIGNYTGLRWFTYRSHGNTVSGRELGLFVFFSAIGLTIENGVLYAATSGLGLDSPLQSNFFKFVGIGVATLFRFWSYRSWVFKHRPTEAALGPA